MSFPKKIKLSKRKLELATSIGVMVCFPWNEKFFGPYDDRNFDPAWTKWIEANLDDDLTALGLKIFGTSSGHVWVGGPSIEGNLTPVLRVAIGPIDRSHCDLTFMDSLYKASYGNIP